MDGRSSKELSANPIKMLKEKELVYGRWGLHANTAHENKQLGSPGHMYHLREMFME
jgi:hypothetical protein